jgi:hypothetical protein
MQRILAVGLFPFWSISAVAEPVFVQSGEHVGFTRLVTRVAKEEAWSVEHTGRKVMLSLEGYSEGFDTSRIFELIPRGRVQRVEATKSTITVYLGCDCIVSAFDVTGGHVALDIISPEQGPPPSAKTSKSPHPRAMPSTVVKVNVPPEPKNNMLSRDVSSAKELAAMSDIQMRLSQELGRGITRGVLNPDHPPPPSRRPQIDTSTFEHELPTGLALDGADRPAANIRITTSMDVPSRSDSSQQTLSDQGLWCPPNDATDVASWGDTRAFDVQISEARLNLFGEFDRLNPDAAILLAKRYLYFGFGAEARQVLGLDPNLETEQRLLMDLANIMDAGASKSDISIQSFADCTGNISLWAFLADDKNSSGETIEPNILLLALTKLPVHLRQHLAPIVSDRFLVRGDLVSAATALRSLERLPDPLLPAAKFAQANVGITTGQTTEGAKKLLDVATANVAQSPEALISLVDTRIDSGDAIDPETVSLVEAYAQELRDSELGPSLRRAHILALIKTQEFDRALREIEALGKKNAADDVNEMREQFTRKLTETASDIVFLDATFQQVNEDLEPLNTDTKILLASRLLVLGFATSALDIVQTVPDRPRNQERQMLAARIALALNQPFQALADLLEASGEAADILRADAKSMAGAHQEAHALYQNANQQDAAVRSGWLAQNWRELTPPDTPIFGQATELAGSILDPSAGQVGMLSRTTAILKESGDARQTIFDLLNASELRAASE